MTGLGPIFLAFLSAGCFGLALVLTQFGLRYMPAASGAMVSVPTTAVLFWLLSPALLRTDGWQPAAIAVFALVGLFFPAAVTLLTFAGNQRMGPTITGTVGGTSPLFAVAAAVMFLDEKLTFAAAAALFCIVSGVALLTWRSGPVPRQWPALLIALPLAAAALRGAAQAATKIGLAWWPNPFAASLIGYTVSATVIVAGLALRHGGKLPPVDRRGAAWFVIVGLGNGAAVFALYAALSLGRVTVVAPIVATYPVYTLLLGALLLHGERITLPRLAGVAATVAGVVLLLVP